MTVFLQAVMKGPKSHQEHHQDGQDQGTDPHVVCPLFGAVTVPFEFPAELLVHLVHDQGNLCWVAHGLQSFQGFPAEGAIQRMGFDVMLLFRPQPFMQVVQHLGLGQACAMGVLLSHGITVYEEDGKRPIRQLPSATEGFFFRFECGFSPA